MAAIAMADAGTRAMTSVVRAATLPVRWIDRALLAHYRIFEFTDDPQCILRVNLAPSPSDITLRDGTHVSRGEVLAELHLWSQRSMRVQSGVELRRRMHGSFGSFARFARSDPRFAALRAVLMRTSACDQFPRPLVKKIAEGWGFEIDERPRSRAERFSDFWDNVYITLLGLAYPSRGIHLRRRLERLSIWISMRRMIELHG